MKHIIALAVASLMLFASLSGCILMPYKDKEIPPSKPLTLSIKGVVLDTNGTAIEGATVYIEGADLSEKVNNVAIYEDVMKATMTTTDANGAFEIKVGENGTYPIFVNKAGFIRQRIHDITVDLNQSMKAYNATMGINETSGEEDDTDNLDFGFSLGPVSQPAQEEKRFMYDPLENHAWTEVDVTLTAQPADRIVVAHRGAMAYAPENTLAAFKKAALMGADMFELDVHRTLDSVLVVIHDDTVDRTTDYESPAGETAATGYVASMTYADIENLDAGSWFDPSFANETIPSLEEALQLAKDYNIKINIEIKTVPMTYPGIEQQVIDMVNGMNMGSMILISSFSPISSVYSGSLGDIETAMLMSSEYGGRSPEYIENQIIAQYADALHPDIGYTTPELVQNAHDQGMKVNVWTVNDPADMLRFYRMGCEGVISNHPDLVIDMLYEFANS